MKLLKVKIGIKMTEVHFSKTECSSEMAILGSKTTKFGLKMARLVFY